MDKDDRLDRGRRRWLSAAALAAMSAGGNTLSVAGNIRQPDGYTSSVAQTAITSTVGQLASVSLAERLARLERDAQQLDRLRSLVVLHRGQLVLARAFRGPAVDEPVNIKSVSKSLVAALVGCAIERGYINDVQMTLGQLIPDLLPRDADPRVSELSLENLLTMQAGLQRTSGPNYGKWIASDDWLRFVLSRPFVAEPGTRMLYSTGDWHVLGVVLSRLADSSLLELANQWLGKPLDIRFAPWTRDPQGRFLGGNEMSLSPVEMVRFGELYRAGGQVQSLRVFSESWVQQSFTARTRSPFSGDSYGYGWFLRQAGGSTFAYARGYGGQFIHVIPDTELVVAMTSDWTRSARGGTYTEKLHALVTRHLLARFTEAG